MSYGRFEADCSKIADKEARPRATSACSDQVTTFCLFRHQRHSTRFPLSRQALMHLHRFEALRVYRGDLTNAPYCRRGRFGFVLSFVEFAHAKHQRDYLRGLSFRAFARRTPGPPPFSSMNSIPASCNACLITTSVALLG